MSNRRHHLAGTGETIQRIHDVSVLRDSYLREIGGDFYDSRLKGKLKAVEVGRLVLLNPEISGINLSPGSHEGILTEVKDLERGRLKSRTGVRFGQMLVDDVSDKTVTELVAAKYTDEELAARELAATLELNRRLGHRATYEPIGFLRGGTKVAHLSRFEKGVISMDNYLWNPQVPESQRMLAMAKAGLWMAELHDAGIIHGDAQAKNVGIDSRGNPRYFDLEGAYDINHGYGSPELKKLLDVSDLFNSQINPIPYSPDEIMAFVDSYTKEQGKRDALDGIDIMDVAEQAQAERQ